MPDFFDKKDRWGNGLALWVVVGMVFLIPMAICSLFSMKMENEVQDWIPRDNADYRIAEWSRRHFPHDDTVLLTWEGSSLEDVRVERLVRKIRGTIDTTGKRRGGSKLIERVRTPQELIGQMRKNEASRDEAVKRLEGVLVGSGPVRIRLSEFGRARRDKVVDCLRCTARDALGLKVEISDPGSATDPSSATADALPVVDSGNSTVAAAPVSVDLPLAQAFAGEDAADQDVAGTATGEPASVEEIPRCPEHDLVVVWRGMHWDAGKVTAFKDLATNLRLPATRSREPSPALVEECFQGPGSPVALAVYLSEAGNADRPEALRWLSAAAVQAGIPAASIHMAGSAVVSSALNREVLNSVWDKTSPFYQIHHRSIVLLSGLVGGILVLWLLKSLRLAGLILGVSYYTTLISTALVPLTGGAMNLVLVVLPTLILVTTLSVALHVANYWRHAAAGNLQTAVAEGVKTAFVPCLWAGLASAIGQASLMTSSLAPVRDFGLYSAIGTVIALAVTLYGLPALLAIWPGKPPKTEELDSGFWNAIAGWIVRRQRLVTIVSLIAAGICLWGLKSFKTESKVIRYLADSTRTVTDYEYIEDRLAGILPVDVIVRFDRESQQQLKFLQRRDLVREIQAGMAKLPDVSGSLSLVDFLPGIVDPGDQAHVRERAKYSAASRSIEARVKGAGSSNLALGTGNGGAGGHPRKSAAKSLIAIADDVTEFNAEGDELWRITAQVAIMSHRNYQELRAQIDEVCRSVLRKTSGNTAEKVPPVGALRSYHPGASHFIAGEIPLFLTMQRALLESVISSFVWAFVSIAVVVMLALRHPVAGLLAMIPNVLPIGAVFGLISWCGVPVDLGAAVTVSMALGITINGTLHLITWFRVGIRQGKSRAQAVSLALGRCGPPIWQTTLVVSVGLCMLCPSDLITISRFGWLMAALLAVTSMSSLALMPALLAGPLGYFIEKLECQATETHVAKGPNVAKIESPLPLPVPVHPSAVPGRPHLEKKSVRIRRAD